MLKKIVLTNFKCFKNKVEIPLANFNLLTGVNGKGKSTLLQSLLLMRQSIEHNPSTKHILFNGSCVNLGVFDGIRNSEVRKMADIEMEYHWKSGSIKYFLNSNEHDDMVADINEIKLRVVSDAKKSLEYNFKMTKRGFVIDTANPRFKNKTYRLNKLLLFGLWESEQRTLIGKLRQEVDFSRIHYVAADRFGPQDFYTRSTLTSFPNVGPKGENTANILHLKKNDDVHESLRLGYDSPLLENQAQEWLSLIFDGAKLEVKAHSSNIIDIGFNASTTSRERYKPINVGFAYSYVLPIIVSGLIAKSGEKLIIENPEAHLHPRAQSKLTQFLILVAKLGVQVFIETHSEHILNALRVGISRKSINTRETKVIYFGGNESQPFHVIPIDKQGNINKWPENFFDQSIKDLNFLFGI